MREVLYSILDLTNLWWPNAFNYYREKSTKLSVYFYCRQNKYTKRKYFRTMRPIIGTRNGIWDNNEWIEYKGMIDDIITK